MDTGYTSIADHINVPTRSLAIENGQIHDTTRYTLDFGISCRSAITNQVFRYLFPWAEDANKGICYHSRLESLIKKFISVSEFAIDDYAEFDFMYVTYVSSVDDYERVSVFSDGKSRIRTLPLWVGSIPDETGHKSLLFGLSSNKGVR